MFSGLTTSVAVAAVLSLLPSTLAAGNITNMTFPRTLELDLVYPRAGERYLPMKVFPVVFAMRNADLADGLGLTMDVGLNKHIDAQKYQERMSLGLQATTFNNFTTGDNASVPDPFYFYTFAYGLNLTGFSFNTSKGNTEKDTIFELHWALNYTLCPSEATDQVTEEVRSSVNFTVTDAGSDGIAPADGLVVPAEYGGSCAKSQDGEDATLSSIGFNVTGGFDSLWESTDEYGNEREHQNCYRTTTGGSNGYIDGPCPVAVDQTAALGILEEICEMSGLDDCYSEPESAALSARLVPLAAAYATALFIMGWNFI